MKFERRRLVRSGKARDYGPLRPDGSPCHIGSAPQRSSSTTYNTRPRSGWWRVTMSEECGPCLCPRPLRATTTAPSGTIFSVPGGSQITSHGARLAMPRLAGVQRARAVKAGPPVLSSSCIRSLGMQRARSIRLVAYASSTGPVHPRSRQARMNRKYPCWTAKTAAGTATGSSDVGLSELCDTAGLRARTRRGASPASRPARFSSRFSARTASLCRIWQSGCGGVLRQIHARTIAT